jgi:hypothetical protein
MVPVIDAIAACFAIKEKALPLESLGAVPGKRIGFFGAAERLVFNIGRIPVKQSREAVLPAGNGKSCRRAEKGIAAAPRSLPDTDISV